MDNMARIEYLKKFRIVCQSFLLTHPPMTTIIINATQKIETAKLDRAMLQIAEIASIEKNKAFFISLFF